MVESNKQGTVMTRSKTREAAKQKIASMLGDVKSKDEIRDTNYALIKTNNNTFGMVRAIEDLSQSYSHESHKDQYNKLADFVMNFV